MRRPSSSSLHDRLAHLVSARQSAEAELSGLFREEEFLASQLKQAQEQVRYYEGLLSVLRREWGGTRRFAELVRKLG